LNFFCFCGCQPIIATKAAKEASLRDIKDRKKKDVKAKKKSFPKASVGYVKQPKNVRR
jgi:hypothetical protein